MRIWDLTRIWLLDELVRWVDKLIPSKWNRDVRMGRMRKFIKLGEFRVCVASRFKRTSSDFLDHDNLSWPFYEEWLVARQRWLFWHSLLPSFFHPLRSHQDDLNGRCPVRSGIFRALFGVWSIRSNPKAHKGILVSDSLIHLTVAPSLYARSNNVSRYWGVYRRSAWGTTIWWLSCTLWRRSAILWFLPNANIPVLLWPYHCNPWGSNPEAPDQETSENRDILLLQRPSPAVLNFSSLYQLGYHYTAQGFSISIRSESPFHISIHRLCSSLTGPMLGPFL